MVYIIWVFILLNFFALRFLAKLYVGKGSDSYFYDFYIGAIKKNRNHFFSVFHNFLNKTYITDPQFFFKLLSFLPTASLKKVSIYLNPLLISLLGMLVVIFLKLESNFNYELILLILIASLLTPQFFYGQNARMYGLNSRGIGLILIFLFSISVYYIEFSQYYIIATVVAIFLSYLIWGTSLFAQQALLFCSIFGAVFFGWFSLLVIVIISAFILYVFHPRYARLYFINRWRYLDIYANIFADRFILKARYSLWRDFTYDFWKIGKKGIVKHLLYIYNNGILAVLFLNPAIIFCIYIFLFSPEKINTPLEFFSEKIIIIAISTCIITSFRFSRVLGEPERYIEFIIPFINIFCIPIIYEQYGIVTVIFIISVYLLINVFQISIFTYFLKKSPFSLAKMVCTLTDTIDKQMNESFEIRFMSNNLDWAKYLLNTKWKFVYYYPTAYKLSGIPVKNLVYEFPFIKDQYLNTLISDFNVNIILLDKSKWLQTQPLDNFTLLAETDIYKLYKKIHNE